MDVKILENIATIYNRIETIETINNLLKPTAPASAPAPPPPPVKGWKQAAAKPPLEKQRAFVNTGLSQIEIVRLREWMHKCDTRPKKIECECIGPGNESDGCQLLTRQCTVRPGWPECHRLQKQYEDVDTDEEDPKIKLNCYTAIIRASTAGETPTTKNDVIQNCQPHCPKHTKDKKCDKYWNYYCEDSTKSDEDECKRRAASDGWD